MKLFKNHAHTVAYLVLLLTLLFGVLDPGLVHALDPVTPPVPDFSSGIVDSAHQAAPGLKDLTARGILDKVINFLLGLVGVLALLGIIWGGTQYLFAFADESKAQQGKKIITWSIIGLIVIGLAAVIVRTVGGIFK